MAKKKGRKARNSSPIDWARFRVVATPVMRVVSALVVVYCFGRAAAHLADEGRAEPRFLVDPGALASDGVPDWVPETVRAHIRSRLSALPPVSIFDERFGEQIRERVIAASPWIDSVQRVERIYPNRARLKMGIRKPIASVAIGGRRYLLDADSQVLHEEPEYRQSAFPFPVYPIFGAKPVHTPVLGSPFPDPLVENAVNVAIEVRSLSPAYREVMKAARPGALYIRGASGVRGTHEGDVCIRSELGGVILRWGRPAIFRKEDGSQHDWGIMEPPPEKKVTHLAQIMEAVPGLRGLEEARLDFARPWYRQIGGGVNASMESDWVDHPTEPGSSP